MDFRLPDRELIREVVRNPAFPAPGEATRLQLFLTYAVRGAVVTARDTLRNQLPNVAGALSFQTLFSLIPVIVIGLTVLTQFIGQQEVEAISEWLSQHILPAQAQQIAPSIHNIALAVDVGTLGIVGITGLIIVATALFWTLTYMVDEIWQVRRRPPFAYRLLSTVMILLLLPTFAGLSVFFSQLLRQIPGLIDFFIPLTVSVAGLFFAYRYVPSARVETWAALSAAILMGLVVEVAKLGFGVYVTRLNVTIRGLYGAIAFIPMSFVWLWVLWLIFLIGVQLTYSLQNLTELWHRDLEHEVGSFQSTPSGRLALLILCEALGSDGIRLAELLRRHRLDPAAAKQVIERLCDEDLVEMSERDEIVPTLDAAKTKVEDVLDIYERPLVSEDSEDQSDRTAGLRALFERLDRARTRSLDDVTLAELLD